MAAPLARIAAALLLVLTASCAASPRAATTADPIPAARAQLAPTGKLRVGLQNMITYSKDAKTGEFGGVAVEISRELARRLEVPFAPVEYASATKMLASSGEWDIGFTAIDPDRAEVVFTAAYMLVPNHYMVATDSRFRTNADVDSIGVRIAAFRGQTNDLYLSRTLKAATLVRADSRDAAFALYSSGQADVFSGTRDGESDYITRAPANRILPESFLDVSHAIALPKEHAAGLAFLAAFLNEVKASGLVADAIGRAGLASERVAP